MAKRTATASWNGKFADGDGQMRFGTFEGSYSATSRFEDGEGTNPEELVGAAHAGCFSMALALGLAEAGHDPERIDTEAQVHLTEAGDGFEIRRVDLTTRGRVPGIDAEEFSRHADTARAGCPISKALGRVEEITLDAQLEG